VAPGHGMVQGNSIAWQQGVHQIVRSNDAGRDGVPSDAHENRLAEVLGWDEVANAYYVDKTAAYEEYLDLFGDNPEMVEALQNPSALPTSIRIELADIELYEQVEFRLQQYPQLIQRISSARSAEHTSELQSRANLVCRLLLH